MIRIGSRSGYDIKQAVERSINFFWRISEAQIYPLLRVLEADQLIRGQDDPQGRRRRRVYDLTPAGESALVQWLEDEDPLTHELRDGGFLKVFFADALDAPAALELLDRLGRRSRDSADELRAVLPAGDRQASERGNLFPLITLRLGIAYQQAVADMCITIRDELRSAPAPLPPAEGSD